MRMEVKRTSVMKKEVYGAIDLKSISIKFEDK